MRSVANFIFQPLRMLTGIAIRRVALEMSKEAMLKNNKNNKNKNNKNKNENNKNENNTKNKNEKNKKNKKKEIGHLIMKMREKL